MTFWPLQPNFGLIKYVKAKIEANPTALAESHGRPLACYAIDTVENLNRSRVPHTNIVRYLLEKGARLDQIFDGKPLWQFTVARACVECLRRLGSKELWVELLQLLLDYGADPDVLIIHDPLFGYKGPANGSSLLVLTDLLQNILSDSNVQQLLATVRSRSTITPDEQATIDDIKPPAKRHRKNI